MPSTAWIARRALMRDYATRDSKKAGCGKKARRAIENVS